MHKKWLRDLSNKISGFRKEELRKLQLTLVPMSNCRAARIPILPMPRAVNKGLIYLSIYLFGETGPKALRRIELIHVLPFSRFRIF